jgi:hypothetical protein
LTPGETLLIRMWETVAEKGIGRLFRPWLVKREGRAEVAVECDRIVQIALAQKEAEAIRALDADDAILRLSPVSPARHDSLPSLAQDLLEELPKIEQREILKKEINVTKALFHAADILENDSGEPGNEFIDDDWLTRWRDSVSAVSNERMQALWGSLLAGEIKSPGSFGLRTLDVVRNLSQSDAILIERLAPFVAAPGKVYNIDATIFHERGLDFKNLLKLQEMGILNGVDAVSLTITHKLIFGQHMRMPFNREFSIAANAKTADKLDLQLPNFPLTVVGEEIIRLIHADSNILFVREVARYMAKKNIAEISILRMNPASQIWETFDELL